MVAFIEQFEAGTNGATISTSNTGFASINNTIAVFSNTQAKAGTLSAKFPGTGAAYLEYDLTASGQRYLRFYLYCESAMPAAISVIASARVSTTTTRAQIRLDTDGTLQLRNATTAQGLNSTTALATNAWSRLEWQLDAANSQQILRIFTGTNVDGDTPDETLTRTYNTGTFDNLIVGQVVATSTVTYLDSVAIDPNGFPPPLPDPLDYRQLVTIDQTVVDADLTDFPVLVRLTSSNFTFAHARSDGSDIRFFAADAATPLDFEVERFDNAGSVAEFWVRVPAVSGSVDTTFWMYYGDSTATTSYADAAGNVWDANFLAVWHMSQDPTAHTVSHVGTSASVVHGTTAATTATWPSGYTTTAGDIALLIAETGGTGEPTPATPANWSLVGTGTGGAGTQGAGAGPRRVTVFSRQIAGAGESVPALTIAGTGAVISVAVVVLRKTGGTYVVEMSVGSDTTDGTGFSATVAAETRFRSGDMCVGVIGANDSVTNTSETITISGVTVGTVTERLDSGTTNGNDQSLCVVTAPISAGIATAAGVIASTFSAASSGPGVLIRVSADSNALLDSSGAGQHADTVNMATAQLVTGQVGKGIDFGGNTPARYASAPLAVTVKNLAAYTLSAWAKVTSLSDGVNRRHIYNESRGATSEVTRVSLSHEAANTWALMGRAGDADALTTYVNPAGTISTGTWYYLGAVFDSSTDVHKLRVNGTETTNSVAATAVANTDPLTPSTIGTRVSAADEFFDGVIDELRISNVARSSAWLKAEYNAGNGTLLTLGSEQALGASPQNVALESAATAETVPAVAVSQRIYVESAPPAEVVPAAAVGRTLNPGATGTGEAAGPVTVTRGAATLSPASIPPAEAVPAAAVSQRIYPASIGGSETVPAATATVVVTVRPASAVPSDAVPTPTITTGPVTVTVASIPSGEAVPVSYPGVLARLLDDPFTVYPVAVWADGETHGNWLVQPSGGQTVQIIDVTGNHYLELVSQAVGGAGGTFSSLVTTARDYGGWTQLAAEFIVTAQHRTPTPNDWEVFFLGFNFRDVNHWYYVVLKWDGWEITKLWDNAGVQTQDFLDFSYAGAGYPVGHRMRLVIDQVVSGTTVTFTVTAQDLTRGDAPTVLTTVTDDGSRLSGAAYPTGKIALYDEDSTARVDFVTLDGIPPVTLAPHSIPAAEQVSAPTVTSGAPQTVTVHSVPTGEQVGPAAGLGTLYNSFDGGTSGADITTGNSGEASGSSWDVVTIGTGTTVKYTGSNYHLGGMAAEFTTAGTSASAFVQWSTKFGTVNDFYGRFYLRLTALPPSSSSVFSTLSGSNVRARIQVTSVGKLRILDAATGTVWTSTTTLSTGVWYRVEHYLMHDAAAGLAQIRLYAGDATTVTEDSTLLGGINFGGPNADRVRYGCVANQVSFPATEMDDIAALTPSWPGPRNTVSPVFSVPSGETVGFPAVSFIVRPHSVGALELAGPVTVTPGAVTVSPASIPAGEQAGPVVATPGPVTYAAASTLTAEAVGPVTVTRGAVTLAPASIPGAELTNTPAVARGAVTVSPHSVPPAELASAATVTPGAVTAAPGPTGSAELVPPAAVTSTVTVTPGTVGSAEQTSAATVARGAVTLSPASVGPELVPPVAVTSTVTVTPGAIGTAEQTGPATVTRGAVTLSPASVSSAEAGAPATVSPGPVTAAPASVGSAEQTSAATVTRGAVTVSPASIGSDQQVAAAALTARYTLSPAPVPGAEQAGPAVVTTGAVTVNPGGVETSEAASSPAVTTGAVSAAAASVGSAEQLGAATVTRGTVTLAPASVPPAEAVPAVAVSQRIYPASVPPTEAVPGAVVAAGPVTVTVASVPTGEAAGPVAAAVGATNLTTASIPTTDQVGPVAVTVGATTVTPASIGPAESVPAAVALAGPVTAAPGTVGSSERLGAATVSPGPATIAPAPVAGVDAVPTPAVTTGPVTVAPPSVRSVEAVGPITVTAVAMTLAPHSISTSEQTGPVAVTAPAVTVSPHSIPAVEQAGPIVVSVGARVAAPHGIPPADLVGSPTVTAGPVTVLPAPVGGAEQVGVPAVTGRYTVALHSVAPEDNVTGATIAAGAVSVSLAGVGAGEAFEAASVAPGPVTAAVVSVPDAAACGPVSVSAGPATLAPASVPSEQAVPPVALSISFVAGHLVVHPAGAGEQLGYAVVTRGLAPGHYAPGGQSSVGGTAHGQGSGGGTAHGQGSGSGSAHGQTSAGGAGHGRASAGGTGHGSLVDATRH